MNRYWLGCKEVNIHLLATYQYIIPLLGKPLVDDLLLSQLGLLVDLSQHLMHHAEQRTAKAKQLKQAYIVLWVAPDVGSHSCDRLTHTSQQLLRQHTHSPTSTPRPAQTALNQGNQGTCGLDGACGWTDPAVHRRGFQVA